jgi:hypothetical protein
MAVGPALPRPLAEVAMSAGVVTIFTVPDRHYLIETLTTSAAGYYWAAYDVGLVTRTVVSLLRWPTGQPQTPRDLPQRPYQAPR